MYIFTNYGRVLCYNRKKTVFGQKGSEYGRTGKDAARDDKGAKYQEGIAVLCGSTAVIADGGALVQRTVLAAGVSNRCIRAL